MAPVLQFLLPIWMLSLPALAWHSQEHSETRCFLLFPRNSFTQECQTWQIYHISTYFTSERFSACRLWCYSFYFCRGVLWTKAQIVHQQTTCDSGLFAPSKLQQVSSFTGGSLIAKNIIWRFCGCGEFPNKNGNVENSGILRGFIKKGARFAP